MELKDLGFDQWFEAKREEAPKPGFRIARVTEVHRDGFSVRNERGEIPAEATGNLLFTAESSLDLPAVGDWVFVQYHDAESFAIIHALLPRRSFLRRKVAGRKVDYQMIAANIDVALIVQACDADFNVRRLERYLVMVHEGRIEPVLVLTKSDLVSPETVDQRMAEVRKANIQCPILPLSNVTGSGRDQLRNLLAAGKTHCLLGSSGVGKTTLLNHLLGQALFETKTVREHDGKGRHATTRRQLLLLDQGAMLIDTPGMRELGNIDVDGGIDGSFSDLGALTGHCRFANCTHTSEAGCAILAAVESGEIDEGRYRHYLKLRGESEYYKLSYVEKRQKDRKFGKFIKSTLKQLKKN